MKPKDLKPIDCESDGCEKRSKAIGFANCLIEKNNRQYRVIKIDNLWYAYDGTKHHNYAGKQNG